MKPNAEGTVKHRVLVVDDHPLLREGVIQLINRQADLACCGEADSVATARQTIAAAQPDLVLLDLRLGDGDGLDLIKSLKAQFADLRILVLSQCDELQYAERALRAGARGFVMKQEASQEVIEGIRTVLRGELFVSRRVGVLVLQKLMAPQTPEARHEVEKLSDRELHIFQLLGAGLGVRAIAEQLNVSVKTVETHRENIKHKLGVDTAPELVQFAADWLARQPR